MRRALFQFFICCMFLLFFSLTAQAAQTFKIDPAHSYVRWEIKHFDFSTQTGKWLVEGTLILDKDKPENSKVEVTIPVANMITGLPELDKHLKGNLFFEATKFPIATFVSNKVEITAQNTAKVSGILTVHGISKPVILDVTLNKVGVNPITEKLTAGFSAATTLKRSDFGIKTLLPGLGDEVKIMIQSEAYEVKPIEKTNAN